jgi:peptide-methionine (R)-S-oxide reductase
MSFEIEKSDDEWRGELSDDRYSVLRKAATEAPFSGSLLHVDADGVFSCGGCHQVLFTSAQKFDSGCGWPLFRQRTEILCSKCGGHLGHVFDDGPTPSGLRYCVNSLALDFDETT